MLDPKIRQLLLSEAGNYLDCDAYISDLALPEVWGDAPEVDIPPERVELLGRMYDIASATIPGLLETYGLSQTNFARYFDIPLRTVQDWCRGEHKCPQYVATMAAEILSRDA